jgi:hypothetical protein
MKAKKFRERDVYPGSEYSHPGSRVKKIPDQDPHQIIVFKLSEI